VLLQPTSPFRTSEHVKAAIALLQRTSADTVVGVTRSSAPHFAGRLKPRDTPGWHETPCGTSPGVPFYEWQPFGLPSAAWARPRTQDLPPRGWENGAVYAFTREHWEKTGNRLGGFSVALPMDWISGLDIDTVEDLEAARALAEGLGI
jgi:CMP-N-acetylneuraminic acid synthetase